MDPSLAVPHILAAQLVLVRAAGLGAALVTSEIKKPHYGSRFTGKAAHRGGSGRGYMAERERRPETRWSTGWDDRSVDGQVWSGVSGEQHREEATGPEQRRLGRGGFMDDDGERRGAVAAGEDNR
jgi:hypothetical protein